VRLFKASEGSTLIYQPNQTTTDLVLREIFRDVRFRRALSLALDRDTINNAVYQGLGRPYQTHVITDSKFYVQEYTEAFTEYDPDEANRLLDEIGLDARDSEGFRLRPDGARLVLNLQYTDVKTSFTPNAELAREFWSDIGIQMTLTLITGELLTTRIQANEVSFGLWHADKSSDIIFPQRPEWYVPWSVGWEKAWGIQWAQWYTTGGQEGEEPPADILGLLDTWEQMQATLDEEEQIRLGREILKYQAENLLTIGTVGEVPEPVIVGENLRNFPEMGYTGFDWLNTYPYHVEQVYFEGGEWSGAPS
jgi:peptide/nickel transport system substrate-binding protein